MTIGPDGKPDIRQYWDLTPPRLTNRAMKSYYVQKYRELLEGAVKSHLMSDVPLGVFLSGGVDSSAVAALMTESGESRWRLSRSVTPSRRTANCLLRAPSRAHSFQAPRGDGQ